MKALVENCPDCGADNIKPLEGCEEAVCEECGLVINEKVIRECRKKKQKDKSKESSRSLKKDVPTSWISGFKASNSSEDNFAWGLFELEKIASTLDLSREVKEEAGTILGKVAKKRLTKGRKILCTVAACTYIACRLRNDVRGMDEISNTLSLKKKELYRTYMKITKKLGIRLKPASPVQYVGGLCSALRLGDGIRNDAIEILEKAGINDTQGRNPSAISAAAVYLACKERKERVSQQEILWNAQVSEVTLRHRLNELKALSLNQIFSEV